MRYMKDSVDSKKISLILYFDPMVIFLILRGILYKGKEMLKKYYDSKVSPVLL